MNKPFKMKGSPFQRNFGVGESETPDAETPLNFNLGTAISNIGQNISKNVAASGGWGAVAAKSLAAGMRTLKGGYDAFQPEKTDKGEETALAMEKIFSGLEEMDEEERKLLLAKPENKALNDLYILNEEEKKKIEE